MDKEPLDENFEDEISDEKKYMDGLSDEGSYTEMPQDTQPETISYDQQKLQLQNTIRNNKKNSDFANRLRQRQINTYGKSRRMASSNDEASSGDEGSQESSGNPISNMTDKLNPMNKFGNMGGQLKNKAKGAAKDAGKAIVKGIGTAIKALATNPATAPIFWIIVILLIIIIIVPVLVTSGDTGDGSGDDGGSEDINYGETFTYVEGYERCSSITVQGKGTYTLEEYVAGVVSAEHANAPMEAKKSLAVAARTIGITETNNCTTSIESSSRKQNFTPNYTDEAMEAANATRGQILTYNGALVTAMYDSWNCVGSNTCTYIKMPNQEKHTVTLSDKNLRYAAGGHGYGMSQLAAADMAENGADYKKILGYFYSDGVEIKTISKVTNNGGNGSKPTLTGAFVNGFQVRTGKPNIFSAPDSNYYYWVGENTFQCVWYAKSRAREILATMKNANEDKRQKALETLNNAGANGSGWYDIAQGNGSMSLFASSNNINYPRPGSIISWKWNDAGCISYRGVTCAEYGGSGENYGHVGIIEAVDTKNKTVTVTDGWLGCKGGAYWSDSCFGFQQKTVPISYLQNWDYNHYIFIGYVYVADYLKGGKK